MLRREVFNSYRPKTLTESDPVEQTVREKCYRNDSYDVQNKKNGDTLYTKITNNTIYNIAMKPLIKSTARTKYYKADSIMCSACDQVYIR